LPVVVSQHCTPFVTAGQLLWQSESDAHVDTHTLAGAGGGVVDGGMVAAGAGSVGCWSEMGAVSDAAQATARRADDRTGRMRLA
jgi:hypothetical protein